MDLQTLYGLFGAKLIEAVMAAAAGALVGYALVILHKLQAKYHLQIEEAAQAKLDRIVTDAIYKAEEWAASRVKAAIKVSAADKMSVAVTQVVQTARVPQGVAVDAVLARLPQTGFGATVSIPFGAVPAK